MTRRIQMSHLAALAAIVICAAIWTCAVAADKEGGGAKTDDAAAASPSQVDELFAKITELEEKRPTSLEEHAKTQKEIKDIAAKVMALAKDKESEDYQKAEEKFFEAGVYAIYSETPRDQQQTLQAYLDRMKGGEIQGADVQVANLLANLLEQSGNVEAAGEAYFKFGELLARSSNPAFAEYSEMFKGAARRVTLVGNEMELKGTRVDGEKFDLDSLQGKVVLVDFWATWCGPCIGEIPNMKANYEAYHKQGFEIVGVSLDQDRDALETFLHERELPWIILHEKEAQGQHPAARRYGIMGIPTMILVGRDGKVLSTRARGEELNDLLKKQFNGGEKGAG